MSIFDYVNGIFEEHQHRNVYNLADEFGIDIQYRSFQKLKGFYIPMPENETIVINSEISEDESRTVIAHELGHFFLHGDDVNFKGCRIYAFSDKYTSYAEREANTFAADFLLDDKDIMDLLMQGYTAEQVAAIQKVPPQLVIIKVDDMIDRGFDLHNGLQVDCRWLG